MKRVASSLLVLLSLYAGAQDKDELSAVANDVSRSLNEDAAAHGRKQYAMPEYRLVVDESNEINAFADVAHHTVHLNSALVEMLKNDRGELAFVIAHEIGHIQDANCRARGEGQRLRGSALQRMCEAAADTIAMQYIMAAGFSPFDAAGFMGRMLMVDSRQSSVLGIVVGRFTLDHPVNIDRVQRMVEAAKMVCQDRPEICEE